MSRAYSALLVGVLLFYSGFSIAEPPLRSERVVVVQRGETLFEIVKREMRSPVHWPAVARYNNIQDPRKLRYGQEIRIPLSYTPSSETAIVLFVKGKAMMIKESEPHKVVIIRGNKIHTGDQIITGRDGFVSLEFSSGSVINIQPDSRVSIVNIACEEQASDCVIELYSEKGDIQSRVKNRINQPVKFILDTPNGVAAVRGTVFDAGIRSYNTTAGVLEGAVDVESAGDKVEVENGFGIVSEKDKALDIPVPLLSRPDITRLPSRLTNGSLIQWLADPQAKSYQLLISKDQEGNESVSQTMLEKPFYELEIEQGGDYYLAVRAIDRLNLKGLPRILPIHVVTTKHTVQTPILKAQQIDEIAMFDLISGVADALSYEVQISESEDFTSYQTIDINEAESAGLSIASGKSFWARVRAVYGKYKVGQFSQIETVNRQ